MAFIKYQHVEKFGNTEVEGIEVGTTYVFPKLDGTNASVWIEDGQIKAGSRNRELTLDEDNAGFYAYVLSEPRLKEFLTKHPEVVLYGEWLVPHTLKTYQDDAWRKFYIFDVYNKVSETLLSFERYEASLKEFDLDYLVPIAIIKNGSVDQFVKCLEKNVFLLKDGTGTGEGVVIKNYDYQNRYGRQTWAKLITNEFKEKHHKEMGAPLIGCEVVEQKIVDKYVTQALVDKVYAKIVNDNGGWTSRYIPQLLNTVFYDLVREETWEFVKAFKNPKVDFKALSHFSMAKVKELRKDVF